MLIRRLEELNEFLKEEKEPNLLRDLMDMFDRLIRSDRAGADKWRLARLGEPRDQNNDS